MQEAHRLVQGLYDTQEVDRFLQGSCEGRMSVQCLHKAHARGVQAVCEAGVRPV